MSENNVTPKYTRSLVINFPEFLKGIDQWIPCGIPKNDPGKDKVPLTNDGYTAGWEKCQLYSVEEAISLHEKIENSTCIGFIIRDPIYHNGNMLFCGDVDFKNIDIPITPEVPRYDDPDKMRDFVISWSSYCEITKSKKGYHAWGFIEKEVWDEIIKKIGDKNIPDTYGVGIFWKMHNIIVTGDILAHSQKQINLVSTSVVGKFYQWTKNPNTPKPGEIRKFVAKEKIIIGQRNNELMKSIGSAVRRGETLDNVIDYWKMRTIKGEIELSDEDFTIRIPGMYDRCVEKEEKKQTEEQKFLDELAKNRDNVVIDDDNEELRLRVYTDKTARALMSHNSPPYVFERSGSYSRVVFDEHGRAVINTLNEYGVRSVVERCVEFKRIVGKKEKKIINIDPPMTIVRDLMNTPDIVDLPPLVALTECPILHRDGTLVTEPGYDPETKMFYAQNTGLKIEPIPDEITEDDVTRAKEKLDEIFIDFPLTRDEYGDSASKTNLIGLLITAIIRPIIITPTPMAIISKPQAGVGSTLIARIVNMVAVGRDLSVNRSPEKEEEFEKRITTWLREGSPIVVLDNVQHKLNSSSLECVLTADVWSDRLLGVNISGVYANKATWMATGNNVQLGKDMPRRCYWITMEPTSARNWQNKRDFKHSPILQWVSEERADILRSVFILVKNWVNKGSIGPLDEVPGMGTFEDWRYVIGGILRTSGYDGFLSNIEQMYDESDVDTNQWCAFLELLQKRFPDKFTIKQIVGEIELETNSMEQQYKREEKLLDSMPDFLTDEYQFGKKTFTRKLGKHIGTVKNRIFPNNYKVVSLTKSRGISEWRIVHISDQTSITVSVEETN